MLKSFKLLAEFLAKVAFFYSINTMFKFAYKSLDMSIFVFYKIVQWKSWLNTNTFKSELITSLKVQTS